MKSLFAIVFWLFFCPSAFSQSRSSFPDKMHVPKYALFFDNHTMPSFPDMGKNFDVEAFTDQLKRCGVDYVTFHARDNMGNAYYDTKIGIEQPSLTYDLFGKLAESCHRKGIAIGAYLNGGLSEAEGVLHRDWTRISFDGKEYTDPRSGPFVRKMCFNTPYHDHLINMVKEIAEKYPVSGFFIDCMSPYPCICPYCIKEMKERGINWRDEEEVIKFSKFSSIRMARDIANALKKINPNLLMYFNGLEYEDQEGLATYNDIECLPTGGWGYEFLPGRAHYIRTINSKPTLNMNGRFYRWADFGGLRPEAAIKSELLYGLANGLRPNIGGHFHPRGDLQIAVFDRIAEIYKELQAMEPWYKNAKNITEIAIVSDGSSNLNNPKMHATVRMLEELKQQFDLVTPASDWSKYKVLVIPDDIIFTDEITRRVKAHISAGKAVISSGSSGLNTAKTQFALPIEWGLKYIGENEFDPAYFTVSKKYNQGLPNMALSLYSSGINVEPLPGTSVEASLVKPYYNHGWDGIYPFYYAPPDSVTNRPALTIHGKVAHFSHRIFSGYADQAPVELRTVFGNVLRNFLPNPLVKYEKLPSFSRVFVTEQPGRRMVHILSYVPELRGKTQMIEEPIELNNINISLRTDGKIPQRVYLAPEKQSLPFRVVGEYINVTIPRSSGYSLIVFE